MRRQRSGRVVEPEYHAGLVCHTPAPLFDRKQQRRRADRLAGGGTGRATFQDLSIVHKIDKASPNLLMACAMGRHLKEATITFRKASQGQQDFLIIKMNDVIITGVVQSAPSGEAGVETVSLEFAKVDWQYKPQTRDGSLDAGISFKFDIKPSPSR